MVAAKLRTFSCTPNKTLKPLPSVAGTLTCGLTHFVRILAHMLAPLSLKLALKTDGIEMKKFILIIGIFIMSLNTPASAGMTMNDLTVYFQHLDRAEIVSDWEWLVGKGKEKLNGVKS